MMNVLTIKKTEQSSPFRRWTTGSGAGSSYRHDHRSMYNKQMSDLGPASVNHKSPSGTNGSGGGGVARWSLGLEQLLADPAGASAFAHFLTNEFANENIRFWWSCEQYNQCTDASARQAQAQEIWQRHLSDGAPEPVNIDASAKRSTALRLQYCPEDLFQQAQKQIFNVMKFDSYPRFLRSSVHAECARADLRGLPLPYAPRRDSDNTPSKLKKSASNASERRRSGGTSLLPWRLRAQNKEQSASTQSINGQSHCEHEPQKPQPAPTNNSQTPPTTNGYTLCRVILPDGATSVVGVEEAMSVRALLERLLRRRHVPTHSFDVLYRDQQQQKGGVPVDLSAPSTVLGGRCVVVERRCVVRVEIGGRCVAVRCRPSRPLRHALTPLLQRYNISPNVATRVMMNGSVVDPDTSMQELDGLRLQVVIATDAETSASATRLSSLRQKRDSDPTVRDCDAESISDLALRLNEDGDSQSCKSVCRSENGSQSSSSCGLVRAALRPGPPLHHHPPDFLDNLRETQQRLRLQQGRPEPLPAAELRSPPPLPPKPRTIHAPAIV